MQHYVDIAVRPDPEFATPTLLNTLFGRLHLALATLSATDIGVSFPAASTKPRTMGDRLRLHGTGEHLAELMKNHWWGSLDDYLDIEGIAQVPVTNRHIVVRRVQVKSSPERLRRRLARRKGIGLDEARKLIPDQAAKTLDLPFLQLESASTGQGFKLFIQQEPCDQPNKGEFNAFGLSKDATVPWF